MKKIKVCSLKRVERLAESPWKPRTSLISMGDADEPPPKLLYKPAHILRLEFDDITLRQIREEFILPESVKDSEEKLIQFLKSKDVTIFSSEQAEQVADFILKYYDDTDLLVCQCHYGQSRSAGCAAAVAEYFLGKGIYFFADERYLPNKLVYHKVLSALKSAEKKRCAIDKVEG